MPLSLSLRRRIVGAYLLLALVLIACVAVLGVKTFMTVEDRVVNGRLLRIGDALIANYRQPGSATIPRLPKVYPRAEAPAAFREMQPGLHQLTLDGLEYHVLVTDRAGERYVLVDDEGKFQRLERRALITLAIACGVCLLAALLLGLSTASRVISPVTRLANAIKAGKLEPGFPLLDSRDELGVLARTFAQHSEELGRFLERERLFTGDVSHELRTPLTVILGAAELLQARLGDRPELQEVADRIRRSAASASEQVHALLLLSRDPASIEFSEVDLTALVRGEVERNRPLVAAGVRVSLSTSEPAVWVSTRAELAAMAIGNLIRNACQYTEAGSVRVDVGPSHVVVEDTGPGIPDSIRERLFLRHEGHPERGGAGFGLAIVGRVSDRLGWQVSMEQVTGGGTRFLLRIPAALLVQPSAEAEGVA